MNVSKNDGASFKKGFFDGSTTEGIVSKLKAATPQNQQLLVGQLLQHFIDHPKDNISDRLNKVNKICPEVLSAALQSTVAANPRNQGSVMTAFRSFLHTHPASTPMPTVSPPTISGVAYPPVMLNIGSVDEAPTGGVSQLLGRTESGSPILNPNDDAHDHLFGIVGFGYEDIRQEYTGGNPNEDDSDNGVVISSMKVRLGHEEKSQPGIVGVSGAAYPSAMLNIGSVDEALTGGASQLLDRKESGSPILNPNDDDNVAPSPPPSYWSSRILDAVPNFHAKAEAGELTDFLRQTHGSIMEQVWLEKDGPTGDRISSEMLSEMAHHLGVATHPDDAANITDALTRMSRDFLVKNNYPPEPTELNDDAQHLLDELSGQIEASLSAADKSQITAGDLAKIHAGLMESVWTTPGVDGVVIEPRLFAVMAETLGVTVALPREKEMYHQSDVFQRMVDALRSQG